VSGLVVEIAAAADLARLVELERRSFAPPWSAAMLAAELGNPDSLVLVARGPADAAPPGYAAFRRLAGEAELLRVAVEPADRRRGVGRRLVAAGLDALRREGVGRCHLEVSESNAAAIGLYRSLGFAFAGRRRRYYADGADACLLRLDLAPPGEPW
jgi:ribosomal-protein-alanine N-acetyltransferase